MAVADDRGVAGDDDVAGQCEFEAAGDGVTLQYGGRGVRAGRDSAEAGRHVGQEAHRVVAVVVKLEELVEVSVGTEARAFALHRDDAVPGSASAPVICLSRASVRVTSRALRR
nr:hypothetical protein [Streptomyces graminofaciens]